MIRDLTKIKVPILNRFVSIDPKAAKVSAETRPSDIRSEAHKETIKKNMIKHKMKRVHNGCPTLSQICSEATARNKRKNQINKLSKKAISVVAVFSRQWPPSLTVLDVVCLAPIATGDKTTRKTGRTRP